MVELADTMDLGSIGRPCRFKSCYPHQLVTSDISLATSFFISLQSSSRAHSAAPRFQPRPAALGSRLGAAAVRRFCLTLKNIDFNRPRPKRRTSAESRCPSFWVPPPSGRLHPSVIQMLGGSTCKGCATSVGQQSCRRLCSEFRLRQGFRLRRKRLYGAKAPRPGRAVGGISVNRPGLKKSIWTVPSSSPQAAIACGGLFMGASAGHFLPALLTGAGGRVILVTWLVTRLIN